DLHRDLHSFPTRRSSDLTWSTENGSKTVVSTDNGQNWQVRGAVNVPEAKRNADEHMIVERKDGTLWMLVRTLYGIGESISHDRRSEEHTSELQSRENLVC